MQIFTEYERKKCSDLMKGMTNEERDAAIKAIQMDDLCKEVERRRDLVFETIDRVAEVVLTITAESAYKDVVCAIRTINSLTNLSDI